MVDLPGKTSGEVLIPLRAVDAQACLALGARALENSRSVAEPRCERFKRQLLATGLKTGELVGWGVHADDKLIAFALALTGTAFFVVEALYVDVHYHRQGHGTRLLNRVLQLGRERGVPYVEVSTDPKSYANGWYKRRGFTPAGHEQSCSGGAFLWIIF